jgi:hypothetical protein
MPDPQVKAGPAKALRAMFAGIGSLLSVTDKIRSKPGTQEPEAPAAPADDIAAPAAETPAAETPAAETTAPEATVTPEPAIAPEETVVAEETFVPDETFVPEETVAPEETVVLVETEEPAVVADPEPVVAEEAAVLPVANYDDLSLASLRARLRNLSVPQLTQLIEYEKTHAGRADFITMFERRIVKVESES